NEGAPSDCTNITAQKLGQLLDNGSLLSEYIFPTTTTGRQIYATGRFDGSGTRTHYCAISRGGPGKGRNPTEKGFPATPVLQYKPVSTDGGVTCSSLTLWPTGDGANISTVWSGGPQVAGNGGFSSGGPLGTALGFTSAAVGGGVGNVNYIGVVGTADAEN